MPITIATWNVNSIRTRLHQLLPWLESAKPDIVLLQELKCVNEAFPALEIETLGYNLAVHGQKTYNGVAILSKFPLEDVTRNIPDIIAPPLTGSSREQAHQGAAQDEGGIFNPSRLAATASQSGLSALPQGEGEVMTPQARYIEALATTAAKRVSQK
jgi:exonuclease III